MKLIYKPEKIVDGQGFYKCIICKSIKSESEYHYRTRVYVETGLPIRETHCKLCSRKKYKDRRNSRKLREMDKNTWRIHKYGIDTEEYNKMYIKQKKVCKMCKKNRPQIMKNGDIRSLHIDHNHDTGRIRGLLCTYCNTSLGLLEESTTRFFRGIIYILIDRFINLIERKR